MAQPARRAEQHGSGGEAAALWSETLNYLRANNPAESRARFDALHPLEIRNGVLLVRTQSGVERDHLHAEYRGVFADALRIVSGHLLNIRFVAPGEDDAQSAPHAGDAAAGSAADQNGSDRAVVIGGGMGQRTAERRARGALRLAINPDNTFRNFVMGPGNRLAHAAASAVAEEPGRRYNPLFIHGGVGLGKTHLLQAIYLSIADQNPDWVVEYVSCEEFTSEFMEAVQAGRMSEFRHEFRDIDMLVIDDVHFLAKRDRTQEEFFHTFNVLYQSNKQIVLSSDAPPEDIPDLEERLVSRFKWGLVTGVEQPDYETRIAIVQTKARLRGVDLGQGVAEHIAAAIDSNIRELEGAIVNLQVRAKVDERPIDLDLARATIEPPAETKPHVAATMQRVIDLIVDYYAVKLSDLQSKKKTRSIARPRQVLMYLARRHTRHSLEEIGGYLGGRDHTTIMHGANKITSLRATDRALSAELDHLESQLGVDEAPD
ncbi:MAG: chromosomal replication initiator protein DnaA [Planctomycetota bacterium]